MLLEKCKINHHNRVKILCSDCGEFNHELETYADIEGKPFTYYCHRCVSDIMRVKNISELKNERTNSRTC